MSTMGLIFNSSTIKGIGITSVASPLPFVFSAYNGIETFSTNFEFNIETELSNSTVIMNNKLYNNLKGPYNRKNVLGISLSYGPFFTDSSLIKIRNQILHWGLCKKNLIEEFGIKLDSPIKKTNIKIKSKTKGNENKKWNIIIECLD